MSQFTEYTTESAPAESRRFMTATRNHLGYLPVAMARMAASPQLLDGFGKLTAIFDRSALDPVAREVVIMTVAEARDRGEAAEARDGVSRRRKCPGPEPRRCRR